MKDRKSLTSGSDILTVIESITIGVLMLIALFCIGVCIAKWVWHPLIIALPSIVLALVLVYIQVKEDGR